MGPDHKAFDPIGSILSPRHGESLKLMAVFVCLFVCFSVKVNILSWDLQNIGVILGYGYGYECGDTHTHTFSKLTQNTLPNNTEFCLYKESLRRCSGYFLLNSPKQRLKPNCNGD